MISFVGIVLGLCILLSCLFKIIVPENHNLYNSISECALSGSLTAYFFFTASVAALGAHGMVVGIFSAVSMGMLLIFIKKCRILMSRDPPN